jgi:hypothetical protein
VLIQISCSPCLASLVEPELGISEYLTLGSYDQSSGEYTRCPGILYFSVKLILPIVLLHPKISVQDFILNIDPIDLPEIVAIQSGVCRRCFLSSFGAF